MAEVSSTDPPGESRPEGGGAPDDGSRTDQGPSTAGGDLREEAGDRLTRALAERAVRDPREVCREHLRHLKSQNPERYREAVEYYEAELLPGIAQGRLEPVDAWIGYAGRLAAFRAAGRMVAVDRSGVSGSAENADPARALLLHLPNQSGGGVAGALPVAAPAEMSGAQRATWELLVAGKKQWDGPDPDEPDDHTDEV